MTQEFRLEDPGEGIHEAEIREIHISEGDKVADGDIILTVETDKAAVEVPAPFSGVVQNIRFDVGDVAEVGDVIMTYGDGDNDDGAADAKDEDPERETPPQDRKEEDGEQSQTKKDTEDTHSTKQDASRDKGPVPASPATRRLARELNVDLRAIDPSGPEGRVTAEDVRAAAEKAPAPPKKDAAAPEAKESPETERRADGALPDFGRWGKIERVPLRSIRRATARHMARSWQQIPHVMHQDDADITDLEDWRQAHKASVEEQDGKLTLTVLVLKALISVLKEFPRFNASLDPEKDEIVLKHYFHIGVAVDTDQGLVVPVVRDVDRKSIVELSVELVNLADKARAGKLSRDEMRGGTFTVTNPGPLGGRSMTPIINHPEVAILGLGQARLEPRIAGDIDSHDVVARRILPLCLAFDHRVNDGADAGRFVTRLAEIISDTETIMLNT
jgi:pyruvate dehydrogenase E2 component (dihydrolipoamide acetyltransferase)